MEQDTAIKDLGDSLCPWRMLCGAEDAEVYMHDQWQPARKWQTAFRISNGAGRGQTEKFRMITKPLRRMINDTRSWLLGYASVKE